MQEFWTSMAAAPLISLWFGFCIESGFRQGTIYNLIGYAAKRGYDTKRVEKVVSRHFAKWNWLLLAFAFYFFCLAIIFHVHGFGVTATAALSAFGLGTLAWCGSKLCSSYLKAQDNIR
jgi:hypothetical protein